MSEKICIELKVDDVRGYYGLMSALESAIELLKDKSAIKHIVSLIRDIESDLAAFERTHEKAEEQKRIARERLQQAEHALSQL